MSEAIEMAFKLTRQAFFSDRQRGFLSRTSGK